MIEKFSSRLAIIIPHRLKPILRRLVEFYNSHTNWLWYLVCLIAISLMLLSVHAIRPYNSDDIAVQVMLRQIDLSHPLQTWVGPQTFVFKYPLFWLLNEVLPSTRASILLTAWLQVVIGFSLYYWSALSLARTFKLHLPMLRLAIAWMLTSSTLLYTYLSNPDYRNMEIGIVFAFLAWVFSRLAQGSFGKNGSWKWQSTLWILVLSLVLASDAMFLFMVMVPLGLYLCLRLLFRRQEQSSLIMLGIIAGSVMGMVIVGKVMALYGITVLSNSDSLIARLEDIQRHTEIAIHSSLVLFDAYIFGLSASGSKLLLIHNLLNALTIALGVIAIPLWLIKRPRNWKILWLIAQPWLIAAIFIVSTRVFGYSDQSRYYNSIYLILIPFYMPFLVSYTYGHLRQIKPRLAFLSLMLVAIIVSIGWHIRVFDFQTLGQNPNQLELDMIEIIREEGLTKGYAGFWEAGIVSYFSDDTPLVIQAVCQDAHANPHLWYLNRSRLIAPASESFIIHSDRSNEFNCSQADVMAQFGQPEKIIPINDHIRIMIYDRDIFM